jgi:hypothetical protein
MEKKRSIYILLLLMAILAAFLLYQGIAKTPAGTVSPQITTTTLQAVFFQSPRAYREAIQKDRLIEQYTKEEYLVENGTGYYEYTGTRKSVIGVIEYSETMKVLVDNATGEVLKVEQVTREAPGCVKDSDCCAAGLRNESLPCYSLASCACRSGRCALVENADFQRCVSETVAEYAKQPSP